MPRSLVVAALAVVLFTFTVPAAGRADKPTKVEIAKRGKAATAFVDVPNRGTGTAFCIHPSGLFLTNEHVVRDAEGSEVTLVLNPSLETQKTLKAKVVRVDKGSDLALLRVEGAKDLPSLSLGTTENVTELADVVACGFPLGKALATDKQVYPAASVNTGTVTSLRQKGGQLQFIQIDVALTYGNSGGPVMDDQGKVIGVVVGGIGGGKAGINLAIPVNQVERFLKTPEVIFDAPDLTPLTLDKPHDFKVRVASFVPNAPVPDVKLILRAGEEKPREFVMKNVKGEWVATAVPVIKVGAKQVGITARVGSASITGLIDDENLTVGGRPVKLSSVRQVQFGAKPVVTLADGKTLEGEVGRLDEAVIHVGAQKVKFDLTKVDLLTVRATDEVASVSATVVVTLDGKEVARVSSQVGARSLKDQIAGGKNLLVNGSFEDGPEIKGTGAYGWMKLDKGSTAIRGWKVALGDVDYTGSYWQHADGTRSLDLNHYAPGGISQTFKTKKGERYRVTFSLAGNPLPGERPLTRKLRVSAAGKSADFEFDVTGKTLKDMGWVTKTWEFTATDDETTLEFISLGGQSAGPALDNLSIQLLAN